MPLDVLSKIQSFANGGSVDAGTKGAINQMIGDAQQNPALQSGLNGIANAVTNNGANINPDTMAQLARAGQAFSKAMEQANLAMLGIHGSFNSIDVTPLEKAEASLTGIAEHGKGISISIGTKDAESSLSSIANRIEKIRASASIGVSVSTSIPRATSAPKAQKFATGGRITYHRQNTETAQTGGIFRHGSSTGDRNMIFANRGEGIITEKAVRQGARQRGMSPESYVQALNHPSTNLAMVKKGRSFQYGGRYASKVNGAVSRAMTTFTNAEAKSALQGLQKAVRDFPNEPRTNPFVINLDSLLRGHMRRKTFVIPEDKNTINAIASYFNQVKSNMEDDAKRQMGNLKRNSIMSSSTPLTMPTAAGGAITSASGVSMSQAISDRNAAMSQPSYSGPSTSISSAQSNDLKNSIRATSSRATISASNLAPGAESTLQGQIVKTASEDLNKLNDFITKATSDQIGTLMDVLRQLFPTMVPEDLVRLFNDAQTNIDHLTEDQMQTIHAIASATAHTDFGADAKRLEREYENVKNEIINDLINGTVATGEKLSKESVRGIKSNIQSIIHDATTSGTLTDAQKENYKNIGAGVSAASQSRHASAEISSRLQTRYGTDLETILRAKQAGRTDITTSTGTHNIDEMIQYAGDVSKIVLDNINNFKEYDEQISSVEEGFDKLTETSDEYIKKQLTGIPLIGKAFEGNVVGTMAMVGAVTLLAKEIVELSDKASKFFVEQARINQKFAEFKSVASGLFDGIDIQSFKEEMNLTREQAAGLSDAFRKAGLSGTTAFSDIEQIAYNIKEQFGALDTSLLQEAVNLINDLPKKQIDVLINGKGTLDDEASMIANLMQSGKLDAVAELITKGAFGEIEGLTPQMSEADKKSLEMQAKISETTDFIKEFLNSELSPYLGTVTQVVGAVVAGIAPLAMMATTTVMTYRGVSQMLRNSQGTAWRVTSSSGGGAGGSGSGREMAIVAGLTMVAAALNAGFQWLGEKMEEAAKEKREEEYTAIMDSIKKNKSEYGVAVSTEGYGYGTGSILDKAGAGMKIGAGIGLATGTAIGGIAGFFMGGPAGAGIGAGAGAVIGTAVGAIIGTAVGVLSGIYDTVSEWFKYSRSQRKNLKSKRESIKILENIKKSQDKNRAFMEGKAEFTHKDMLKGITELSRISKVTKKISDGEMSANNQANIKAYQSNMNMMGNIGGNKNDFMLNASSAVREANTAFAKDFGNMRHEINSILNQDNLTAAQKEQAISDIQGNQLPKIFDRFIDSLNNSIAQFDKVPEIVVGGIKAKMQSLSLERANNNMFGSNSSAFIQGSIGMDGAMEAAATTMEVLANDIDLIKESMEQLDNELKKTEVDLKDAEEAFVALGGDAYGAQVSNGNSQVRKGNATAYNNVISAYESSVNELLRKNGYNDALSRVENINASADASSKIRNTVEKGIANGDKWSEEKTQHEAQQLAPILDSHERQLENIISSKDATKEEKENAQNELKALASIKEDLKDAKEIGDLRDVLDTFETSILSTSATLQEGNQKRLEDNPEMKDLRKGRGELYTAAIKARTAQTAATGATNARVKKEKLYEQELTSLTNQLDAVTSSAEKLAKAMIYTADVMFADYMKDTMKKSAKYDSLRNGGVENSGMIAKYEASAIAQMGENIPNAQKKVEEKRSEWDEVWNKLKDTVVGKSGATSQYFELMQQSNEAKMKAMQNPHDEALAAVAAQASKAVEEFYENNSAEIEKFAKENEKDYTLLTSAANGYGNAIKTVTDSTAEYKQRFMEFIDSMKARVDEGTQNDYGFRSKRASANLADALYEMAQGTSDFSKMFTAGNKFVDSTEAMAKEEIELTKKGWQRQFEILDEKFAKGEISQDEYQKERAIKVKESEEDITRKRLENAKKVMDAIDKKAEGMLEKLGRQEEGLNIEKDLYETIGAPFEYILDVEQELVKVAKDKAAVEEQRLADAQVALEKGLITQEQYDKQELKTKKASAEVIKASFGAQRDALDKLLGKMMGGFEQIGGIFGPDSDFMKARKAGQGYTQLPSGMISASGGTVTDYANRVAGLRGAAGMQNGVKMGRGDAGVFGNGRGIPGMANGGLFGDWISRQWKQLKEGMNNTVGNVSGDTGYAITPNGNKVRMNRKEAIFNYDTLTALARPLGETPEQYVADALSGNPYSGIRAEASYTNMGHDMIFGRDRNRFRKYDDTTNETPEQAMARQLNEKRASALALGMEHQYRNENLMKKGEDGFIAAKDARGNSIANRTVKGNAESRMNATLRNSAFGGMAENAGSAGATLSSADKLLLAILEDTHKIVEAIGVETDWKKYEELANGLNKKGQKQQKLVKQEGDKNDKTDNELKKENDKIYGKKGKQNRLNAEQTARVSANNDKIAGHAYDAIARGSRTGAGEEKASVEQALDTDREILQYVKLIYDLLRQGGGFVLDSVVKSSMVSSHGAKTTIPKNEDNEESAPKFHAPSSVSATAIVAGISAAEKEIPKLVNGMNNIPKAMPKVTAFFKNLPQKASALEKGAMNWLGSSKAGELAKTTAGKMGNFGLGLSKWGNGLRDDFLLGRAGELYGANEKGVSLASRTANRMGNWGLSLSKGKMGNFGLGLSKWGNGLRDDFLLGRAGELYGANEKGVARTSRLANKFGEWTKNIGSKTGSRVGELASKVKNAEWVNKVANGVKGSTSSIVNGTKPVFARGLPRAPKRALIGTLGRSGATRTLNVAGKGMRFAGKGMRLAGRVAPYADLALAGYGAYKGWTEGATKEGVEEQMRNNHKNYGGEYFDAAGKHFKNGNYLKGIGNYAMRQGRLVLASMDYYEHGKNIGMAGRLTYDTIAESYGQADRMKGMSAQSSVLNARRAKRLGIKKSDYDAEVKMLLASEEGKRYRKRLEAKQNEDTGWFGDFTGNLLSFGGQNRAGKANVEDSVRMWADAQAKKNLSARQRTVEQSAKEAETAVARQSEEVRQLAGQIKEEAVKVASEQDVKSGTAGSYEGSSVGVAGVMNSELTPEATRQYNTPVKEMNATVEPVQTHVQQGRGAYSGQSDTVAEKARDALSRIEAGVNGSSKVGGSSEQGSAPADNSMPGQGQSARGMQSGRINVEVHITMDTKLFRAEVVKVARENIQSILNKPGTATV